VREQSKTKEVGAPGFYQEVPSFPAKAGSRQAEVGE
jgi:hypothetical protein